MTLNSATGKIRNYQLLLSIGYLLIFVGSYLVLNLSNSPVLAMAVTNVVNVIMLFPRLHITKDILGITIGYFFREVLFKLAVMSVISATICLLYMHYVEDGWVRFFSVCILSTLSIAVISYRVVFTFNERKVVVEMARKKVHTIFNK